MSITNKRVFSFEFFPPRNDAEKENLPQTIVDIAALGPQFVTVTYGAGGSKKSGTFETLKLFQKFSACALGSHITHLSSTKEELDDYADLVWEHGIRHLVALRGDDPKGVSSVFPQGAGYYHDTAEFVAAMALRRPFDISVAAYPEKHPKAPSLEADILSLKKKCDAGAARAITQFFFENDAFYRFRDKAYQAGVTVPIVPGLMRITSFEGVQKFAAKVQTSVPLSLKKHFAAAADPKAAAQDILAAQVQDLVRHGVDHVHFYTMNKADGFSPAITVLNERTCKP